MTDFRKRHVSLIESCGGVIEDDYFVMIPGCKIIAATAVETEADALFSQLGVATENDAGEKLAEFGSRLTYLSAGTGDAEKCHDYNVNMVRQHQHLSVWGSQYVTFMLAGIAVETSMELLAHTEARGARLTTSNTRAMDDPLFRVQGHSFLQREAFKTHIQTLLKFQARLGDREEMQYAEKSADRASKEWINMMLPGCKATSLTYTMSVKDFHKLFIGRLSTQGNEQEVQSICTMMCAQLHERYPIVIRSPEEYYAMNNGEKLKE